MLRQFIFIITTFAAITCSQQNKEDNNIISEWGLVKTVNVADTIRLHDSSQELKFRFTPKRTNSRYQIHIFFPSAQSNYYHVPGLESQFRSFKSLVNKQFVGTSITIQNENQDGSLILNIKKDNFDFNVGKQRPPSIWLASGVKLNQNEEYTISIQLHEKRVEDEELRNPILVVGQGYKVSL